MRFLKRSMIPSVLVGLLCLVAFVQDTPLAAPRALFGAYVRPTGVTSVIDAVTAFESKLGRKLGIVNKYHNWSMTNFSDEAKLIASGYMVMVSWHPTDGTGDPTMASEVASGRYDSLIRLAATNMKPLGRNVLLRWDFEMTQPPGRPEYVGPPGDFIAAWRHIHDIFVAQGATNVQWVWAPQSAGFSDGTAGQFYPGDSYVDWIEASDVMGGKTWPTFAKLFTPMYQWAAPRGKPLLVWVGVPENPSDPNWKANWFDGMRATIETSMPAVKGVIYYQAQDFAGNFLVDTTQQSGAAFRSMALDPYFSAMP
jgi:hypothetical protein